MTGPTIVPDIPSIKDHVDKPLGTTDWVTLPQEQINAFAEATGDTQWIHVDVERAARESPFGRTIAHGYLTLALAPRLLSQLLQVENASRIVNYGIDKMRLPAAVPAGATGPSCRPRSRACATCPKRRRSRRDRARSSRSRDRESLR